MQPDKVLDVVVIGAGHAGLGISYHLQQLGLDQVVIERGSIGNSWSTQRWDSFRLNTANKMNQLPGSDHYFSDQDGFCSGIEFVSFLEDYAAKFKLPVLEHSNVLEVVKDPDSGFFWIKVENENRETRYRSRQLVVASGAQNVKHLPSFSKKISHTIYQMHACDYRNPSMLPEGAVLVVGSAQSGVQITEELIASGRQVYLSTSKVARFPRAYRGKDIVDWLALTGYFDLKTSEVSDPGTFNMKFPQISGVGKRGHTVSLQALARAGVTILGSVRDFSDGTIWLETNAPANVKFGDEFSGKIKNMIEDYIRKSNAPAPLPESDAADEPDEAAACASPVTALNLARSNVSSIIWTTGFRSDFSYLKFPVFNGDGMPVHQEGATSIEGLYFLGLPWLRKRKSGIIMGIKDDAEFIARNILAHC